ncbi:hypothetical protein EOD29_24350 [Mesorhizobium sp. M1A.T.Ca.IN.004.03.1.1]|nr:hypothetical protein EOD29_24350 [Mesorhizobium sp. M1A.T.Ca.IN.004.03.1.1]
MPDVEPQRQLPIILPPVPDELLSSWISRHAAFYGVPPLIMLRHCLPKASSLRAADLYLADGQLRHLAKPFATEPHTLRRMTFSNVAHTSRRLIAAKPAHTCPNCISSDSDPKPTLRSQLLGWRIICPLCGGPLHDSDEHEIPSPFCNYRSAALHGERLIDDEAEQGVRAWASPLDIVRLLLMRRDPKTLGPEKRIGGARMLGIIVPEFDAAAVEWGKPLPSAANPILPLNLRPGLLAGVAIVERAGPAMLEMLHARTIGENRTRFGIVVDYLLAQNPLPSGSQQLWLI